ncbi:ESF1-like protein [Armadillidium vulgare]|nr:ESF1-like protein [Armadillidium vulgare]
MNENKTKLHFNKKKKGKKYTSEKSRENEVKAILSDPRFANIASDPRYRNISKKATKIQIDKRFKDALMNERFNIKPTLDPRGRPKSYGTREGLDKFYDLESSEDESEDESDTGKDDDDDIESGNEKSRKLNLEEKKKNFLGSLLHPERDLARGDNYYSDDSSDDDSSTTDEEKENENEFADFEWGELDADAVWDTDGNEVEETNRFAVCDMDWDNVKAVDLFVLFSSFIPAGNCLKKVVIYPSEYGKARMAEEEISGPQELVKLATSINGKNNDDFSNLEKIKKGILDENDCASSVELEALRRYQRNRLKYYYAVVECDSVETARAIYKECDRSYFEVIGVTLDLRYIPSDMEFDEVPHDVCEKIPASYESENITGATSISHAKPVLTWDETDKRRKRVLRNTMTKALKKEIIDDDVLNDFVAVSGSDEDSEEEENESSDNEDCSISVDGEINGKKKEDRIAKFRALISEIDEKERKREESNIFSLEEEAAFAAGHERDSEEEMGDDDDEDDDGNSNQDEEPREEESNDDEMKNLTPFEKMLMKGAKRKKEIKLMKKKLGKNREKNRENDIAESEDELEAKNNSQKEISNKKKKKNKKYIEKEVIPQKSNDDLALLVMDEEQEEKKHFDMIKIKEQKEKMMKNKRKRNNNNNNGEENEEENDNDFEINTSDSRFSALFTSGDFSMDPSHPKFDKHSLAAKSIMQKQKKMKSNPVSL